MWGGYVSGVCHGSREITFIITRPVARGCGAQAPFGEIIENGLFATNIDFCGGKADFLAQSEPKNRFLGK